MRLYHPNSACHSSSALTYIYRYFRIFLDNSKHVLKVPATSTLIKPSLHHFHSHQNTSNDHLHMVSSPICSSQPLYALRYITDRSHISRIWLFMDISSMFSSSSAQTTHKTQLALLSFKSNTHPHDQLHVSRQNISTGGCGGGIIPVNIC